MGPLRQDHARAPGRGAEVLRPARGKAVFFARFFSGLRVFGALVAGVSRMRFGTFLFYDALGGVVWATAAVSSGGWARRASCSPPSPSLRWFSTYSTAGPPTTPSGSGAPSSGWAASA